MSWLNTLFQSSEKTKQLKEVDEANAFFAPIVRTKPLTPISVTISLDKNEQCYYTENGVELDEMKAVRYSKRSGGSGRIMKGVWVNTGNSVSESIMQLRQADTGVDLTRKDGVNKLGC